MSDFNNTERAMIRRSLTILRNVDPADRPAIDALITRIESISQTAYDSLPNGHSTAKR